MPETNQASTLSARSDRELLSLTKRADNAVISTKQAHLALLAFCFLVFASTFLEQSDQTLTLALEEIDLLSSLSAEGHSGTSFIWEEAAEHQSKIITEEMESLLSSDVVMVEWQETPSLTALKSTKSFVLDGDLTVADPVEPILEAPLSFHQTEFVDDPSIITQTSCLKFDEQVFFESQMPRWDVDGGVGQIPTAIRFDRGSLDKLFFQWNSLLDIVVRIPTAANNGTLVIDVTPAEASSIRAVLPARLSEKAEVSASPCDSLNTLHGYLSWSTLPRTALPHGENLSKRGLILAANRPAFPGAVNGMAPWYGLLYWEDDYPHPIPPDVSLKLALDFEEARIEDAQQKLLSLNRHLKRPRGFSFGEAAVSFPGLHSFLSADEIVSAQDNVSTIRARLLEEISDVRSDQSLDLYAVKIPLDRLGFLGLFVLGALQAFYILHLRNLRQVLARDPTDEAWFPLHRSRESYVAILTTSVAFPTITVMLLSSSILRSHLIASSSVRVSLTNLLSLDVLFPILIGVPLLVAICITYQEVAKFNKVVKRVQS